MTDHSGVLSIRAARRYRWRLAGGRLIAGSASVCFAPNRLERRRADTYWATTAEDVTGVRMRGKVWLVVETVAGEETFRVFGAAAAARKLEEALHLGGHGNDRHDSLTFETPADRDLSRPGPRTTTAG
jgi:hypothetical protein